MSQTGKKEPGLTYSILRILDCGFLVEEAIPPEDGKIQLGYGMHFLIDEKNNWIRFNLKAEFGNTDFPDKVIANQTVLTEFSVNGMSDLLNEDNNIVFPSNFIQVLFGISFSHLRAIMAKNLAGSRFANMYLPVINPQDLFRQLFEDNIKLAKENPSLYSIDEINTQALISIKGI